MPRPPRNKIEFSEESMNDFLQEIYEDSHRTRSKITRLFTKWEGKVKEEGNIAAFGDQVVKLITAEIKNQDQKIMLLKYLKDIVFEKRKEEFDKEKIKEELDKIKLATENVNEDETADMSDERRNELMDMVHQELLKKKGDI